MKIVLRVSISLLTAIFSAILLYSSFPPYHFSFLAWVVLVPLFIYYDFARYTGAFLTSLTAGTLFCALYIKWLNVVPAFPLVGYLFISIYTGLYFGLFGFLYCFIRKRTKWPLILVAPVLWVSIEYLRSNLFFLAIPLGLVGHSQYSNIPLIQIASITSVYGISFLIVMVNAAISESLVFLNNKKAISITNKFNKQEVFTSIAITIMVVTFVYLWGIYQIDLHGKNKDYILNVSLIQGNIPQYKKWDQDFRKEILSHYGDLTLKASQEQPDLIIWPETATPGYLRSDPLVYSTVYETVKKTGIPLLLGSASNTKIKRDEKKIYRLLNSAFLLDDRGRVIDAYNKTRLLPFGEYLPLEDKIAWPQWLVPENGVFVPGRSHTVFNLSDRRFGVVICWESLFPDLFRKFVLKGSQFMVNLTNEAWFGKTSASQQFLSMSVFRAVENRVSLLRCANSGITSIIDPLGRIQGKVSDQKGNDIMVSGILTTQVPKPLGQTFYTKHGDIFAIICTILSIVFIISALLPLRVRNILRISED
jgi:apolipoprotein N-acyltransferase